jgi:glutathione synthase/RimK-type ligase-like ATP-grasp enzyme
MTTILGCRKCRPTGKNIAMSLQGNYTEHNIDREGIIIRYGNSSVPDPEDGQILNKLDAVQKSSNKPRCKKLLMDAGIPTPRLFTLEEVMTGHIQFPVIVRPAIHFKGRGFNICNSIQEVRRFPTNYYIQEIVDKIDEYRLFILKDRIIEANIKEVPEGTTPMVRNHETGCFFRWIRVADLHRDLKRATRDAMQTVGLDFGAVDCATIQTRDGVRSTIFEINSAPGLIPRKIELFKTKLIEMNIL